MNVSFFEIGKIEAGKLDFVAAFADIMSIVS